MAGSSYGRSGGPIGWGSARGILTSGNVVLCKGPIYQRTRVTEVEEDISQRPPQGLVRPVRSPNPVNAARVLVGLSERIHNCDGHIDRLGCLTGTFTSSWIATFQVLPGREFLGHPDLAYHVHFSPIGYSLQDPTVILPSGTSTTWCHQTKFPKRTTQGWCLQIVAESDTH